MIDPTSDEYFDVPRYCPETGLVHRDWREGSDWKHCPCCGEKLITQAELDDVYADMRADESVADVAWQIGVEAMRGAA